MDLYLTKCNIIIQQQVSFKTYSCLILRLIVIIHTSSHTSHCHTLFSNTMTEQENISVSARLITLHWKKTHVFTTFTFSNSPLSFV
uniref:Uncharacterized protein n=1 Tax=Castor canadensis TaxID=51338 RepID=A0A8C0VYQ9_CASCN